MIKTKGQYEEAKYIISSAPSRGSEPYFDELIELLEALRELAVATNGVLYGPIMDMGKWNIKEKLDALPNWLLK